MLLLCILKIFNLLSLMKSDCQQNDAAPETDTVLQSLFLAQSLGSNLSQNINNSACTASFKWTSHLFVPFHPPVYHAGCQNTTQMGKYQGQENTKMYERCLCWSMHRHKDMAFNVFFLCRKLLVLQLDILDALLHICTHISTVPTEFTLYLKLY